MSATDPQEAVANAWAAFDGVAAATVRQAAAIMAATLGAHAWSLTSGEGEVVRRRLDHLAELERRVEP